MSNIEFEYVFTVPNQSDCYEKNQDDCKFVCPIDEDKKPIVVLFGWAGAKDKYLSVYSRIYEAKGFRTFRCLTSLNSMFLSKSDIPLVGEKVVKLLAEHNTENRPLIVHCFSNGGSFIYQYFAEALKSSSKPLQVKGVIFDSAPAKRTLSSFFNAIRPIVGGSYMFNLLVSVLLLLLCISIWIWQYFQKAILRRDIAEFKPLNNLLNENSRWPQLFIYSKVDDVVPYQDVEYFANHRKSLGVEVTTTCFEDTKHVKHYPAHKMMYTQSIFNFINKCLETSIV